MQPHWHYRHVCIRFRAGLWVTSTGQAHWGPVLLNNTRLHARVHMPPGLYVCSQSHPEHQWHSGSVHYWEANFDFDRKIIADKIQSRFSYNLKFKSLLFFTGESCSTRFTKSQMQNVFTCLLFSSSPTLTFCHVFIKNKEHGSCLYCFPGSDQMCASNLIAPGDYFWLDHFQTTNLISSDWISCLQFTKMSVHFIIVFVLVHWFLFSYRFVFV